MNRPIKFRAWHEFANEMMTSDCPSDVLRWKDEGQPVIIMQYTGLKDKSGKEIYEGDIVSLDINNAKWVIEYRANSFDGIPIKSNMMFYQNELYNRNYLQYEVIGNIYENTELLKPKT